MTIENERWIEGAYKNFLQAIDEHNYSLAQDIILDVEDAGFTLEAKDLEKQLLEQPLSAFALSLNVAHI